MITLHGDDSPSRWHMMVQGMVQGRSSHAKMTLHDPIHDPIHHSTTSLSDHCLVTPSDSHRVTVSECGRLLYVCSRLLVFGSLGTQIHAGLRHTKKLSNHECPTVDKPLPSSTQVRMEDGVT